MWALLLSLAFAGELGPEPVPSPPVEEVIPGQCAQAMAIRPGKPLPEGLVDENGNATCGGVLLPGGQAKFYAAYKTYADYELRPALLRANRAIDWQAQLYEEKLKLVTPRPIERPGVQRMLGRVDTLLAMGAFIGFAVAVDELQKNGG